MSLKADRRLQRVGKHFNYQMLRTTQWILSAHFQNRQTVSAMHLSVLLRLL